MTIINNRSRLATDPIRNFRFLVKFYKHVEGGGWTPSATLGFTQVSGLSAQVAAIPYREGGYNTTVHQIPGQAQFSPVTMQRGMMLGTSQHWDWLKTIFSSVSGAGARNPDTSFRADVEIYILNHPYVDGAANTDEIDYSQAIKKAMKIKLFNAWITSIAYSDLNAGDNAFLVEQITLVHEGFDIQVSDASLAASPGAFVA